MVHSNESGCQKPHTLPLSCFADLPSLPMCPVSRQNTYCNSWFGSVPLKTYLPDGDIDLSVFQSKGASLQDSWTTKLCHALQAEGRNHQAPYRVRDVQVIHAEVRQC